VRVETAECPSDHGELGLAKVPVPRSRGASDRCESSTTSRRFSMTGTWCPAPVWLRSWRLARRCELADLVEAELTLQAAGGVNAELYSAAGHVALFNPFAVTFDAKGLLLHVAPDDETEVSGTQLITYRMNSQPGASSSPSRGHVSGTMASHSKDRSA